MSYPEYTKCTSVNGALTHMKQGEAPWNDMIAAGVAAGVMNATAVIIIAGILGAATAALAAGAVAISLLIAAMVAVLTYCDWWLNYRLICLDGDNNHCVIGFVAEFEPPWGKTGFDAFDTDFSMNLAVLGTYFNYPGNDDLDTVSKVAPFGYLLKDARDNAITDTLIFRLTGTNSPGDDSWSPYYKQPKMKVLHAEFEGGGIATLRDWVRGLILLLILADALAIACSAGLFWACILLAFLLFFFASGALTGLGSALDDQANPGDIDKSLEQLSLGNIVLVTGRWVYDAGHVDEGRGWNEIHPIRHCQIIDRGVFKGDWGSVFPLRVDEWCKQVAAAGATAVIAAQKQPENGWNIHPLIDGCRSPTVPAGGTTMAWPANQG